MAASGLSAILLRSPRDNLESAVRKTWQRRRASTHG